MEHNTRKTQEERDHELRLAKIQSEVAKSRHNTIASITFWLLVALVVIAFFVTATITTISGG